MIRDKSFSKKCKEYGLSRQQVVAYRQHNGGTYDDAMHHLSIEMERLSTIYSSVKSLGVSKLAIRRYIKDHPDLSDNDIISFYKNKYSVNNANILRTFCREHNLKYDTVRTHRYANKLSVAEVMDYYLKKKEKQLLKYMEEINSYKYIW